MRKVSIFCFALVVAALGMHAWAQPSDPFVSKTTDRGALPNLVPMVRKTVPKPAEPQPRMRPLSPPDDAPMRYDAVPDIAPEDFPSGPASFDAAEAFPELPLSSQGRWLHSAVVLDNKMWVFGGVSAYSERLMNDLWVFTYKTQRWEQLQRSFVPPFPPGTGRPDDVPAPPALKDLPFEFAPLRKPVPVVQPEFRSVQSGVGFAADPAGVRRNKQGKAVPAASFLELGADVSAQDASAYGQASLQPTPAQRQSVLARLQYAAGEATAQRSAAAARTPEAVMHPEAFLAGAGTAAGGAAGVDWRSLVGLSAEGEGVRDWPAISTDLWAYDLDTKQWQCVLPQAAAGSNIHPAPQPETRWLHTAAAVNGRMAVFGGAGESGRVLGDMWLWAPAEQTWTQAIPAPGAPRPLPRQGHCTATVGDVVYVFGGVSYGAQPFNDLWAYNTVTNAWTELAPNAPTRAPAPRWLTACAAIPGAEGDADATFYVFGGVGGDYVPTNDFAAFSVAQGAWLAPAAGGRSVPPHPRMLHSMVVMGSHLHVFGGVANNIPFDDLHSFDLNAGVWSEALPMGAFPLARAGASACVLTPPVAKTPPRPMYDKTLFNFGTRPNFRWSPRYRKTWNDNRFLIVFGGAGIVQN